MDEKAPALLVIGAGGRNELAAWGPSNPKQTFTRVDPTDEILQIAENKLVKLGLENRVRLIRGTIDGLLPSESKFDAASCILVLHFIDGEQEKLKLLKSIKGHLKHGAPFVLVSAYGDRDNAEL